MIEAVIGDMDKAPLDTPGLVDRARSGDADSFWALCEPLQQRLIRQAFVLCRDADLARDLAQETLIAAWNSIHRYNGHCQFGTWLCSILFHKHKSAVRRSRWLRFIVNLAGAEHDRAADRVDTGPTPDSAAQISERARQVLLALDRLPAKQRETIFLRFYAGESLDGIAAAMKCSVGTVKSRLFHALENLRTMSILRKEYQ